MVEFFDFSEYVCGEVGIGVVMYVVDFVGVGEFELFFLVGKV